MISPQLEELDSTVLLHPTDPRLKANCRLWIDFVSNTLSLALRLLISFCQVNTKVVPSFYTLLNSTMGTDAQSKAVERLQRDVTALVQAADEEVSRQPEIWFFP